MVIVGWRVPLKASLVLVLLAGVASCGDMSEEAAPTPGDTPTPTATSTPAVPSPSPDRTVEPGVDPRLQTFIERCVEATRQLDTADFRYDSNPHMSLGRAQDYRAVLQPTGSSSGPGSDLPDVAPVVVTCRVFARLSIADSDVEPGGWEERVFEPSTATTWDWMVTPNRQGRLDGVIELKPAAQIESGGQVELRDLRVLPFKVSVEVQESWWDRLARWTRNITVVQGLLVAITALITALAALWGLRRRRQPGPATTGVSATTGGPTR